MITLRAVLNLPAIRRGLPEVVAGRENLERPVRWVHAGEVPNMASLLKGGELLLTTGMGVGNTAAEQRRYLAALDERGIAGCALELGQRFTEPPESMIREADRRELPFIVLHRVVRFVDITEAVHQEIVNRQFALMRRGDQLHRQFTELLLDGAGIPEILASVASSAANPVLLVRADDEVLFHVTHHAESGDVLAAWNLASTHRDESVRTISFPVPMGGGETWGQLVTLELDTPLDDFDRIALEQAAALIGLTLLRSRQEEVLAIRERGNFLTNLLEFDLDEREAHDRAASMGFSPDSELLLPIAVARRIATASNRHDDEHGWALIWRGISHELSAAGVPAIAGVRAHSHQLLMVVGLRNGAARTELADRVALTIHGAAKRHLRDLDGVSIAVGSAVQLWGELRAQLREVADALISSSSHNGHLWYDATRPDLDRLLWSMRSTPELRTFVLRRLRPILEHDAARKAKLLPTLEAYCAHGGRKAETARTLHLERQSLYHRLARIEALLGEKLDDESTNLSLHLAVRALRQMPDADRGAPLAGLDGSGGTEDHGGR